MISDAFINPTVGSLVVSSIGCSFSASIRCVVAGSLVSLGHHRRGSVAQQSMTH